MKASLITLLLTFGCAGTAQPAAAPSEDDTPEALDVDNKDLARADDAVIFPNAPEAGVSRRTLRRKRTDTKPQVLITIDARNAEVRKVLSDIFVEAGKNVVIGDNVNGRITIMLKDIPWEQAVFAVAKAKGYKVTTVDGMITRVF